MTHDERVQKAKDDLMNGVDPVYTEFLELTANMKEVPAESVMYYRKPRWWQFRRKRQIKKLLETS